MPVILPAKNVKHVEWIKKVAVVKNSKRNSTVKKYSSSSMKRDILDNPEVPEEHRSNVLGQIIAKGERISIDSAIEFIDQKCLELILTESVANELKSEIKSISTRRDNSMVKLETNKVARVHYTGTLPDTGEVFDSSEGREPLTFLVTQTNDSGFEEEMIGAAVGEQREFTLEPERAYGERIEAAVQQIEKSQFGDLVPDVGMMLMSDIGPFTVSAIDGELVTVDFNHKLAGKN